MISKNSFTRVSPDDPETRPEPAPKPNGLGFGSRVLGPLRVWVQRARPAGFWACPNMARLTPIQGHTDCSIHVNIIYIYVYRYRYISVYMDYSIRPLYISIDRYQYIWPAADHSMPCRYVDVREYKRYWTD